MKLIPLLFFAGLIQCQAQEPRATPGGHIQKLKPAKKAALTRAYVSGLIDGAHPGHHVDEPGVADVYTTEDRAEYKALRCETLRAQIATPERKPN